MALFFWHTPSKQLRANEPTPNDQLARPHLQCWTKDTRTPMHVGQYRGVLDQKLGSLSNDDDDGNENGRKAIGINWQNITLFWSNGYFANRPFFTIPAIFAHAL